MLNLKYYLRGLGIGIVVTALIMGITAGGKESLSNAEIKERAKALGMVEEESTLLKDIENKEQEQAEASGDPDEDPEPLASEMDDPDAAAADDRKTDAPEEASEPDGQGKGEMVATPQQGLTDDRAEDPGTPDEEETEPEGQLPESGAGTQTGTGTVTVQIARGDGSYAASKRLEEAGLIGSASEFDTYLYQNGYDKKIRAGSFEIPADADNEKIAKIICGME